MRSETELSGVILHEDGNHYWYDAVIYGGETSRPDRVDDIRDDDGFTVDGELFELLENRVLADANERIKYSEGADAIEESETVDEYLMKMAKVWHPEELRKMERMESAMKIIELIEREGGVSPFAEKTGIPKRTVEDWKAGRRKPRQWLVDILESYLY